MKTKKSLRFMAAAVLVCGLLVFNFFVFPNVLAATPENRGLETITPDSVLPTVIEEKPAKVPDEPKAVPDINAITGEQAIEIAKGAIASPIGKKTIYEYKGSYQTIRTEFYDVRYLDSTDPAIDPAWFVLFSEHVVGVKYEYIPDGQTPEQYLKAHQDSPSAVSWECRLGTDEDGVTVVILETVWTTYAVVEVNALTGESNYWGSFGVNGGGIEKAFYDDDLRRNLVREVLPEPEPEPTPEG